jgi:hypothetical protein
MANINHPSVSALSDAHLSTLANKVGGWLSNSVNLAKTGIPEAAAGELVTLAANFKASVIVCENKGVRNRSDIALRNACRKALLIWFKSYFTQGVIKNEVRVSSTDRLAMGWYPIVPPRAVVPPPKAKTFLQEELNKNGNVRVHVWHNENSLGKPRDAAGVELYYALSGASSDWLLIDKYTSVRDAVTIQFPVGLFGCEVQIRGRWYNHNGVGDWSEVITFTINN